MGAKNRKDSKGRVLPTGFSERKDGVYQYAFTVDGKRHFIYDSDLSRLKREGPKQKQAMLSGAISCLDNPSFNTYFQRWMETVKKPRLKEFTYLNNLALWNHHIKDTTLGRCKIKDIRRTALINALNGLYADNLSWNTVKLFVVLIHSCLESAVNDGYILKNPASGISKELERNDLKPKEVQALTEDQQERFLDFVKNSNIYSVYSPFFTVLSGTGCRIGELTGITWHDVDLFRSEISVNHTLHYGSHAGNGYQFYITSPKTASSTRTIPMIGAVRSAFIRQMKNNEILGIPNNYEIDGYKEFVFTTKSGKPFTNANVNRIIDNIVDAINAEETASATETGKEPELMPHISAHNFRHTFCTRLCESTDDIKAVQQILGHSSAEITLDVYTHVTQERKRESVKHMEERLNLAE